MVAEIQARVPEYQRPGDDVYAQTVRLAVEQAVTELANRVANPHRAPDEAAVVFRRIGAIEAAEGRSLEAMQSALRVGAQVVLRRLRESSQPAASAETLGLLGEAILMHLDELAAVTAAGYAEARARSVGELERRRYRLIGLLLADPPAAEAAISELAHLAQWRLPQTVAVGLLDRPDGEPSCAALRLPGDVLMDLDREQPRMIIPDPDGPGRRTTLTRGLAGHRTVIGPSVPLHAAAKSLRWAQDAASLARQGIFGADAVIHCDDRLAELLLFRDAELLQRLTDLRLAPMADLSAARQDMLAETLLAWLQVGRIPAVAALLHVHPQTVRYRLRILRARFGEQLHDSRTRFELELALTARQRPVHQP
jgi:hypothetical protein